MDNKEAIEILDSFYECDEVYAAAQEGIKALKKQIPKVILRTDITNSYLCPTCNTKKFWRDGDYCNHCGQKLEWQS